MCKVPTHNKLKYPIMIDVSLIDLFNSISNELLITVQSCTILICLYAIILVCYLEQKISRNLTNKDKFFNISMHLIIFIL